MTISFALLLRIILVALCFGFSAVLAYRRQEGWGWFLFVGVILVPAMVSP